MRPDSYLLGVLTGIGLTLGAIGLYQVLISKGYAIAVELAEAGWTPADLRRHKKAAAFLPWLETMRAPGPKVVPFDNDERESRR